MSKKTILIVDDEPHAQDVLKGYLLKDDYHLQFASNGQEALAMLPQLSPDVILLDVMMPQIDGFEVCRRLKANKRWQATPVILVTALGSKADLVRGLEAGADDFLAKPVDELELRARTRSMLRIKTQYDELQATLRLREGLAHMIAHDMRTPLNCILGYSEIARDAGTPLSTKLEYLAQIEEQSHHLNSFLNDMLAIAKMESGRLILNRTLLDLNPFIRRLEKSHLILAQSQKIRLRFELPEESRQIFVDETLFRRVLDNLLSNALKFSPAQSAVTIRVEYPAVKMAFLPPGAPSTRIRVLDQGPGVDPADWARIFNRFETVPLAQSKGAQIGLGLTFCRMVLEAHDGRIFVEDNQPSGAIFTVEI